MKIGIDLGGSHIGVGLINDQGKIIQKEELDLIGKQGKIEEIIVDTIINNINKILRERSLSINDITKIGIGSPGIIINGEIVKADNLGIQNFKLLQELKKHFNVPMQLTNDAKCAAMAAKNYGELKEFENCVFLTIGTGIGGAVFWNGKLLKPKKYPGFEFGHMVIQKDGLECKCGKKGCFERYASITALKTLVRENYKITEEMTGLQLYTFIKENQKDKTMNEIIDKYVKNLAVGIGNIIDIFEPESIGIGGSLAHYEDIIFAKFFTILPQYCFGREIPQILMAKDKNDAGMIGAVSKDLTRI